MLTRDPDNLCKAYGNGTFFDISGVLEYPAQAQGPGINPAIWNYWYSPCKLYPCDGYPDTNDNAVCQLADQYYNCGTMQNAVWLWNGVYSEEGGASFSIYYPGGWQGSWRNSNVTFIQDSTVTEPKIQFISESPYLQYNFIIRAPCIGQDGCNNTFTNV